jgi:maleamate amidohydrolase
MEVGAMTATDRRQEDSTRSVAEVEHSSAHGFGVQLGWGRCPAILVVDFARAYTSQDTELRADLDQPIAATQRLLDAGRRHGIPIFFTSIAYTHGRIEESLFVRKIPAMDILLVGSDAVQIDTRLTPREGEYVIFKEFPSAFAGTPLASHLVTSGVDTIVIAGCSTSGCIRSSVVDAITYGFRPVVVKDCVGDRWAGSHALALAEMASKYADVITLGETIAELERLREHEAAERGRKR